MSKLCSPKVERKNLVKNAQEKLLTNCNFKIYYPIAESSEDSLAGMKQQLNNTGGNNLNAVKVNQTQSGFSKRKSKFQCHYEERKKLSEIRRKNLIQKLKNIYKIDVEDFREDVVNEIIMKVRLLEKERRERKQRSMERSITMMTRLLKEQKYRLRETKAQCSPPKPLKRVEVYENVSTDVENFERKDFEKSMRVFCRCPKKKLLQDKDFDNFLSSEEEMKKGEVEEEEEEREEQAEEEEVPAEEEEEKQGRPLTCLEIFKSKRKTTPKIFTLKPPPCVSFEKHLECTPKRIVFNDYKKDKVYLQDLRITNVGFETIHCRYLGILVHVKGEGKLPIGVAVRDNVKLRPGLSCSTKIRLCSPDDSNEMECSIVYETRRKKKCLEYSWFFVPVACVPARALVKVTPLRIVFPAFTWCAATGSENPSYLRKLLKIENRGGKACWCKISETSLKPILDVTFGEEQGEEESLNAFSAKSETVFSEGESPLNKFEFYGEHYFLHPEIEETAKLLVNELIENVFATFRFSKKYRIEIPPFSVQQIEVRFIPKYKGFHHEMKYIQFEDCYKLEEQSIELMGDIKQIPLKVEPQVIDLKTCIINSGVYAGIFQVCNCSKGPYTVRLRIPPSLKNHAHVHPRTAIIQPFSTCVFSVRIYPRVTLSKDAPRYFDEDSGVLEFPVRVHPANVGDCKLDYIKLYVHALITTFDLELSPPIINFGTVTTLETVRTKLELTNYSLVMQEYGFLNLPKGTTVEPNMGFGRILPKETIALYLIYSPTSDVFENGSGREEVEFDVAVTSITKYGGFRENWEPEESFQEFEFKGEDYVSEPPDLIQQLSAENLGEVHEQEESEDSDLCDEDFSREGEQLMSKLEFQENKIRNFLKSETDEISLALLDKGNLQTEAQKKESEQSWERLTVIGECGETENFRLIRPNMNVIKCRANVIGPRCQISETVIQLPATPFNSSSLYRFHLKGMSVAADASCACGFKSEAKSCGGKPKFKATFEFLYSCPQITMEPGSGFLKAGDSVPITIIFRPEVSPGEVHQEPKIKKPSGTSRAKLNKRDSLVSKSNTGIKLNQRKNYEGTPKDNRRSDERVSRGGILEENSNLSAVPLKKSDFSMEEDLLQQMTECFFLEIKVRCVIKTLPCEGHSQMTETHDMVLICPAIKRHFNYLDKNQEINFGKVFIGTQSQIILHVQNNTFDRICPSMTLLNPAGPFFCPGSFCKVEIDPEHVWRQPLTFQPEECKENDQFFEIYFGPTSVFLKVVGEGIEPQYNIFPAFGCCLLEAKMGTSEEIKLDINNLSPVELFLQLETAFVREGFDLEIEEGVIETEAASEVKLKTERKEEVKDKKKSKNAETEKRKYRLWETAPEAIMNNLEYFMDSLNDNVFTLVGVGENNNFVVPPNDTNQIKIQFWAPAERSEKKYAVKYNLLLGRGVLKEMIILGRVLK